MRRTLAGIAALTALIAGCSAEPSASPSASPPATEVETTPDASPSEVESPTSTSTSPSREALFKVLADAWGEASEEDRTTLCVAYRSYTKDELWEAMGSPDTVTPSEYDLVWRDYCQDY